MSSFNPTIRTIDPPPEQDELGEALLHNLGRFVGLGLSWDAATTFLLSFFTLGMVPLVFQTKRFMHHAAVERNQWRHIAEWLKSQGNSAAAKLHDDAEHELRPPNLLVVTIIASLIVAAVALGLLLALGPGPVWQNLRMISGWYSSWYGVRWGIAYSLAMTLGAAAYYAIVIRHERRTADVVREFNDVAVDAVEPLREDYGLHGLWLVGAMVFLAMMLPWGAILMLAGGAQRRYITESSVATRAAVAERLREIRSELRGMVASPPLDESLTRGRGAHAT
jgi:hypothetical protein